MIMVNQNNSLKTHFYMKKNTLNVVCMEILVNDVLIGVHFLHNDFIHKWAPVIIIMFRPTSMNYIMVKSITFVMFSTYSSWSNKL